jgi:alpha-tubulin suppressor-like RCC1 family protein
MKKRVLLILGFTILTGSCFFGPHNAFAQDETITNAAQLAAVIDQSGLWYPLVSPTEQPLYSQALGVFWADFSQLTNAIGDVRNFEGETQYGVTVWRLRLTRTADQAIFSYPSAETNLFQLAVSEDGFSNHYDRVLWSFCVLSLINPESYDDLLADGYTFLDPKRIVLDIWLADINDCDTYNDNVSSANSLALGLSTGGFTTMDEEPDGLGGSDPCSIASLLEPFYITSIQRTNAATTITWQSCPMFRYLVQSADALSTNTAWATQSYTSYVWGQPGASATSWTDLSTTNTSVVTDRFYRVQRLLGNVIAVGEEHSLVVLTNGTLWVWGGDDLGELGDGGTADEAAPEPITAPLCVTSGLSNVVAVAAGSDYSLAVDANGVVWSWGDGASGQLGDGEFTNSVLTPSPISGVSNIVSVAAGLQHTLALRADGVVWAWGDNGSGELGIGASPTSTNSPALVAGLSQIVAIAAGDSHSVALDSSGRVWAWGQGFDGELGDGGSSNTATPILVPGISNVIAIAAGLEHTIALTTNQIVWTWGDGTDGDLGRTGDFTRPGPVTGLSNVVSIAAGQSFTIAVTSNGQVFAWGENFEGDLGTITSGSTPQPIAGISNAVLVSAHPDGFHGLAVTVSQETNQYYGWGDNGIDAIGGEVGDGGGEDDQPTPALLHFDNVCTTCVQLGTSGSFTAQYTGTLKLYFNDTITAYDNNGTNSYLATVYGLATNLVVGATNGEGVVFGIVTKGSNYTYSASGFCSWGDGSADPDGKDPTFGVLVICADQGAVNNTVCPGSHCFSLVGRIQ